MDWLYFPNTEQSIHSINVQVPVTNNKSLFTNWSNNRERCWPVSYREATEGNWQSTVPFPFFFLFSLFLLFSRRRTKSAQVTFWERDLTPFSWFLCPQKIRPTKKIKANFSPFLIPDPYRKNAVELMTRVFSQKPFFWVPRARGSKRRRRLVTVRRRRRRFWGIWLGGGARGGPMVEEISAHKE